MGSTYLNKECYEAYTGNFENGSREGSGEIVYMDGTKIIGIFKNGKLIGKAEITYADGSKAVIKY